MRKRLIKHIIANWKNGYDEFETWRIKYLERVIVGNMTSEKYILSNNEEFPIKQNTDIKPLLEKLTDEELIACYDGQLCQKFR